MREDDVQVPKSELLDDSALEGITGGLSSVGAGSIFDVANNGRMISKLTPPPPPPPPFQDG